MNKFLKQLSVTLLLSAPMVAFAYIPLIDNQPITNVSCPLSSNPSHTEMENGDIIARNYNCTDEGTNIVWSISIPKACESGGCGLIVDIHGGGMNANTENYGTRLREFGQAAQDQGASTPYIVAQPSMTDIFNDAAGEFPLDLDSLAPLFSTERAYWNELPHINNRVLEIIDTFNIDQSRIHLTGFSRGSYTVDIIYCGRASVDFPVASYGLVGGFMHCDIQPNKPVMLVNGFRDNGLFGDDNKMMRQDVVEASVANIPRVILSEDENWETPFSLPGWLSFFFPPTGQHIHSRFSNDTIMFESIRHSAAGGFPYLVTAIQRLESTVG